MNDELELLLDLASRRKITHAEVYRVSSQSQPVFFEGNVLKQLESSQSVGTALRIWQNNRPGLAVAYGKVEPELLIDKAISLSQLNPPQAIELTPPRQAVYDLTGTRVEVAELITLGNQTISQLREEYPDLVCSAEFEYERESTTLIDSEGLYCHCDESGLSCSLGAELIRGEDFLGIYDGEYCKQQLDLDPILERIIQRLDWAKYNVEPLQGNVPVLLTANAATLLWDTVCSALNAKRVKEQSSPWSDRQKQLVVSEKISLSQQPELKPYDCPFDDEGTPTQRLELIHRGVLSQFYSDRTTAQELNLKSTGNGFRGDLESYPSPGLINLIVATGDRSWQELVAELDNGIIIDQILGGGADITGNFSANLDLGYRVERGKIIGRVKDTAISGNVYQILNRLIAIGNDALWNGSCKTPSLLVEGISVVG